MEKLKREALQHALSTLVEKRAAIEQVMEVAEAKDIDVNIITPVQYQTRDLINLLFKLSTNNKKGRPTYACFTNLGAAFFETEDAIDLARTREIFIEHSGIYVEKLEELLTLLVIQKGEGNA